MDMVQKRQIKRDGKTYRHREMETGREMKMNSKMQTDLNLNSNKIRYVKMGALQNFFMI